jgi:hypothetical protein
VWKKHKKSCSPVWEQANRILRKHRQSGDSIGADMYRPGSLESWTTPGIISETSAIGCLGIHLNPGRKTILTFRDQALRMADIEVNVDPSDVARRSLMFERLDDLPILERFLFSCEPLGDLRVARESVQGALLCVGDQLDNLRIRACGFTALDWAAKKGNKYIVEWLCTDPLTKGLVHLGSAVGWACYKGQVDIANTLLKHGADPSVTQLILWGGIPPLFVAARNG